MLSRPSIGLLLAAIAWAQMGCIRSDPGQIRAEVEDSTMVRDDDSSIHDLVSVYVGEYWQIETFFPPFRGDCVGLHLEGHFTWVGRVAAVKQSSIELTGVTPDLPGFNGNRTIDKSTILSMKRIAPTTSLAMKLSAW